MKSSKLHSLWQKLYSKVFNQSLEFHVRLFNILTLGIIIAVFIILFPVIFFRTEGYHGGMPIFFVCAVIFTFLFLDKKLSIIFASAELIIYTSICLIAYYYPETVTQLSGESAILIHILVCFITVSLVCGIVIYLNLQKYNRQNEQLRTQKDSLTELDRQKTEFLGNVSHELKTPLTIVSGYAQDSQSILRSDISKERLAVVEQNMKIIVAETNRLAQMVSQLLDLTAIEESCMHLHKTLISPLVLIQDTLNTYYPLFANHGNTISIHRDSIPSELYCDTERIRQVLINLLSNAAHYTENGNITISLSTQDDFAVFTISDNGKGISPELLPHIFERYRREIRKTGDGRNTNTSTGLGLFISKYIVEAHGGSIHIDSILGKGTSVYFTIPLKNEPS